jgi:hypothetical protein
VDILGGCLIQIFFAPENPEVTEFFLNREDTVKHEETRRKEVDLVPGQNVTNLRLNNEFY